MTTLQKTIIGAAFIAAIGTGIFEARQNSKLQNQIQTLQQQQAPLAKQIQQLQADNESLSNRLTEIGEAKKMSEAQFNELLKLRGQVGVLRQQTNGLAELEGQISQLQEQVQNLKTNQLSTSDKFELAKLHYGDAASAITVAAANYMKVHDGQYPASFDQLNLSATNFASDVEPKNFEFEDGTNSADGKSFFFHVQVPIQNSDGTWIWIYGSEQDGHGSTEIFNVNP